jgi:hypothetical protein
LQDENLNIWGFTLHRLIKKSIRCANTIGAVITERNTLTPLCLFIMTLPFNKAVASGNGNRFFTWKQHVQIANDPRRHNARTRLNYHVLPDTLHFSLPSTFKIPYLLKEIYNILYILYYYCIQVIFTENCIQLICGFNVSALIVQYFIVE